ncbi:MAG: hypothetical protein GPJ52_03055 [Candidatus Heimdallarchaeota archaeon]|nr:hypothetical protein [Candidatus Heimdallarchaeota archaeon]
MITSQKSTLTLPELLFERFTEILTTDDGKSLQILNTLTSDYTKEEIRSIIDDPVLRSIRCSSNERAVDITVLRALSLEEKQKAPAVIVVWTEQNAREVLSLLDEQLANAHTVNHFTQIKRKRNFTQYGNPDFILCSYHKLFKMLSKEKLEKVAGIVFLTPLSRSKYQSECILLDQILNLLPNKAAYTFIHGKELRLRKEDLEWLFAGPAIVYKREEFSRRDLLKDFRLNLFEDRNLITAAFRKKDYPSTVGASYLLKIILTATFHSGKNLKKLKTVLKQSISYKFYSLEQAFVKVFEETTKYTIVDQLRLILRYLTINCQVKLVVLKENYRYKITEGGRKFLYRFCFSDGLAVSLFYVLHALSIKLVKGHLSHKDLETLMNDFTDLNIIWDIFYLDDKSGNYETRKAISNSYSFRSAHDIFEGLDEDFGLLAEDAKKSLAAQKTILRERQAYKGFPLHQEEYEPIEDEDEDEVETAEVFEERKITKIYSKEFLERYLLGIISRENITTQKIAELAARTGIGTYHLKTTLERLARKGLCEKIATKGVCHPEVIYGTDENIAAEPFLKEECGNCVSYAHKTRLCKTNRLKMEVAYSTLDLEQLERASNPIPRATRACGEFQEASKSNDFTLDFSEFGTYTSEINEALSNVGENRTQNQFKHNCLFCNLEIKAFGAKENPNFPSKTVTCPHCNSKYIQSEDQEKVRCVSDIRNVFRSMMYNELAYIPEILKQKEERIPLTICDGDILELIIFEGITESEISLENYFLLFNDRKFVLTEVERVYFLGEKHIAVEAELKHLGFKRVYRKKTTKEGSKKEQKNIKDNSLDPITKSKYQQVIELLRDKGVMINPTLISKINSAITFILAFKASLSGRKKSKKSFLNKELGECIKILMRAKDDVNDPEAARILEGQAFNQAFKILKKVGQKAGIRSWGRVVSRLVTWLVFAFFTRTCAYSSLDAMLNHLFKVVLTELKDVHRKVGVDVDLGAGLLHYRKSKSDIDRIGLFLDLVDFVRLIVIFVLAEAISTGEITSKDCRLFLGRGAIPLYDIKLSSLKKYEALAERVLAFNISYKDKEIPLKEAYEDYLKSFRLFLNYLSDRFDSENLDQLSKIELDKIVNECLQKADCLPISFRITDFESKLRAIDLCSDEWKFLYEGFEERFLTRKNAREEFRIEAMSDLFGKEEMTVYIMYNNTQEKYKVSLTKYQKRERRWTFYLVLILSVKAQENGLLKGYSLKQIQNWLGLKYTRARLFLKKLLDKELLERNKIGNTFQYKLNTKIRINRIFLKLISSYLFTSSNLPIENYLTIGERAIDIQTLEKISVKYAREYFEKPSFLLIDDETEILVKNLKTILKSLEGGFNHF